MDDIIAVAVILKNKKRQYFLTWGRIQDNIDSSEVEKLVLEYSKICELGSEPMKAQICRTLQEAKKAPYFYEYFFVMAQKTIPYGKTYEKWREKMNKKMKNGKEIYYLGKQ
ncbi:MAG TPA: hypothetical protein PLB05_01090 [Candidatus Omnitrophota bacterium]|nr:hypothetical protein [Candidatus Omnitrophota bacterium]